MAIFGVPYWLTVFVSAVILLMLGLLLLAYSAPSDVSMRHYGRGRRKLAYGYIACAALVSVYIFAANGTDRTGGIYSVFLVCAYIQSFAILSSLSDLSGPKPAPVRDNVVLAMVVLISAVIFLSATIFPEEWFARVFYICLSVYYIMLGYGVRTVISSMSAGNLEKTVSENAPSKSKWLKRVVYVSASVLAILPLSIIADRSIHLAGIILNMTVCIFLTIKYINYPNLFKPAAVANAGSSSSYSMELLADNINRWIAEKRYLEHEIFLDTLASQLGTNQTYLSRYVNDNMETDFKSWIKALRIEEAKRMMTTDTDRSISDIADLCGIPNRNTFSRQFSEVVGMSPTAYRKKLSSNKN